MSFPPFSMPFQFAAKFGHDTQSPVGAFSAPPGINAGVSNAAGGGGAGNGAGGGNGGAVTPSDNHVQRYQTNGNHFNQNVPNVSVNNSMQYAQNIPIPYSQSQDLNFLNAAVGVDQKGKIHPKIERDDVALNQHLLQSVNQWQNLVSPGNTVADYPSALLPLQLQQLFKYSESIKKENSAIGGGGGQLNSGNLSVLDSTGSFNIKNGANLASLALGGLPLASANHLNGGGQHNGGAGTSSGLLGMEHAHHLANMHDVNNAVMAANEAAARAANASGSNGLGGSNPAGVNGIGNVNSSAVNNGTAASTSGANTTAAGSGTKKPKKKKPPKEKKPRPKPGEIRVVTALDGSVLYCCPECQMAYQDRSVIEQHVISHAVDRRFVCDICNAALKRKDHLTRHKLSHIPDRPHVCNICAKSFKRKEQLTLHIVIHSGEKKHVCIECGKGFYRKDHLRKHTRSHIARRVKCEVSAQNVNGAGGSNSNGQNNPLQGS